MEPKITPEQAVKLCNRNFGIGADGVIFAMPGWNGTDYTMRIFNSDGSEPEVNFAFNDSFTLLLIIIHLRESCRIVDCYIWMHRLFWLNFESEVHFV